MKAATVLQPKETKYFKSTILASLGLAGAFALFSYAQPWSPKRGLGLVFGFLATAVFVFEMVYPWRRRIGYWLGGASATRPLSNAKIWLQAHIYLGVIGFLAVLLHAGLRWPEGAMGWWLLGLSVWATMTGFWGVFLQKWIPAALADGLRIEALYERIPKLVEKLRNEADQLTDGASDVVKRFYRQEVRSSLEHSRRSWAYLVNVRAGQERAIEPFRRIADFVEPEERELVEDLMSLYIEKLELDAQYSLQGILKGWLVFHVPTAALLFALMVVHIVSWVWY